MDLTADRRARDKDFAYHYEALDPDCIRTFKLEPAVSFNSEVRGELVPTSLKADGGPAAYNALFYSWGPTHADGSHLTGGTKSDRVQTPRNRPGLDAGYVGEETQHRLLALRPLWIDAICINQSDLLERASQVDPMASICYQSVTVVVWLGEPDEDLKEKISKAWSPYVPSMSSQRDSQMALQEQRRKKRQILKFWRSSPTPPSQARVSQLGLQDRRESLRSLLRYEWFHRRWVLQEMYYARECDILIGDSIHSRTEMRKLFESVDMLSQTLPLRPHDVRYDLFTTCFLFSESKCSDPRDRVYALKHLSTDGHYLKADYNKSISDTYLRMHLASVLAPGQFIGPFVPKNYKLSRPHCYKFLQLLAVASCKRRSIRPDGGFEVEAWMPDWNLPNTFVSPSHEAAVRTLMSMPLEEELNQMMAWTLPQALDIADSGYCYVQVQSRLIRRTEPLWLSGSRPYIIGSPFALALGRQIFAQFPRAEREHDCIWFPYTRYCRYLVGFVLRPGNTRAMYHDKPVYALHTCFVIDQYDLPPDGRPLREVNVFHGLQKYLDVSNETEFYLE